ncbi:head-tail connector protein [Hymenobacter sublimis]|uniref:Head-tail connector protein n=1 Tax=Hymenobacter sublimis TaxID=2933777 RepID=A0ABY4JCJ5_9BACT|nr:head-tail connector protein [Hymenobacter sublimis]UPL50525.1 head-tail connector protein [Hymenobacter sublimis]
MPILLNPIEPVSIELFKAYSKLIAAEDSALIELFIRAAREKAEKYTNVDYISKVKSKTFSILDKLTIPTADILSVSGVFTSVDELENGYTNYVEYLKGSIIERSLPIDYAFAPSYTITYGVEIHPEDVPAAVKIAIAKIAADLYENRENSTNETNKELSISFKTLLAPYRKLSRV